MAISIDYLDSLARKQPLTISVQLQILITLLTVSLIIFKIWCRFESIDYGYRIAEERKKSVALDMERRELELHLSVLLAPNNLGKEATKRIGLVNPNNSQLWRINR